MSEEMIKLIAAGVLLVHGLGHGGALGALAWIRIYPGTPTGGWLAARSWLVPSLVGDAATTIAAADQAALYGLLARLRDAGLGLIAVERTPMSKEDSEDAD